MIDEQNPQEDYITKIDLLNRIDSLRPLVEKFQQDSSDQREALKTSLIEALQRKNMENSDQIEQRLRDFDSKATEALGGFIALSKENSDAIDKKLTETIARVEYKLTAMQELIYRKIDDSIKTVLQEGREGSSANKKEVELMTNNSLSGMTGRVNEMRQYLDTRLSGLEEATLRVAQSEVADSLAEITVRSVEMQAALESCRKETIEAMTKFQAETMLKFNQMNTLFIEVKNKFAGIAKTLG